MAGTHNTAAKHCVHGTSMKVTCLECAKPSAELVNGWTVRRFPCGNKTKVIAQRGEGRDRQVLIKELTPDAAAVFVPSWNPTITKGPAKK